MNKIYLDNNATTAVDPAVAAAMLEELNQPAANPSSVHDCGKAALRRLTHARQTIAHFLQVRPSEILFNSGATESLNQLLRTAPRGHSRGISLLCLSEQARASFEGWPTSYVYFRRSGPRGRSQRTTRLGSVDWVL